MAQTDQNRGPTVSAVSDTPANLLRTVVYVVAGIALCVAAWALTNGDERDLTTQNAESASVVVPTTQSL